MAEESKEKDPVVDKESLEEAVAETTTGNAAGSDDQSGGAEVPTGAGSDAVAASSTAKKKKSKKAALKKMLGGGGSADHGTEDASGNSSNPASKLTDDMVEQLLEMNPALKGEVAGLNREKAVQAVKKMDVSELLTGMVSTFGMLVYCGSSTKLLLSP